MNDTLVIVVVVVLFLLIGIFAVLFYFFATPKDNLTPQQKQTVNENLRALIAAQRGMDLEKKTLKHSQVIAASAAADSGLNQDEASNAYKLGLKEKLKFAHLRITVLQVRMTQLIAGVIPCTFFAVFGKHIFPGGNSVVLGIICLFAGPIFVAEYINGRVKKRFKAFDKDYATFLMSFVSMLKTGMNILGGLETAAQGLDQGCLVRAEVHLMLERIRVGLKEEQAIGVFGEDINHPEIELFVQALILGRRMGGNLSSTLERLAKQVRKRSQFRKQAEGAIGMERGSMKAVTLILAGLMVYIGMTDPVLIMNALTDEKGWIVTQFCLALVCLGFYLMKKVTNIKV